MSLTDPLDTALADAALYNDAMRMVLTRAEEGDPAAVPVALHLLSLQDDALDAACNALVPLYPLRPDASTPEAAP